MDADTILLLHRKLELSGVPIVGVSDDPRRVDYAPSATQAHQTLGNGIAQGFNTLTLNASYLETGVNQDCVIYITPQVLAFNFTIWRNNGIIATGVVADGQLEFASDSIGLFCVELSIGTLSGLCWVRVKP